MAEADAAHAEGAAPDGRGAQWDAVRGRLFVAIADVEPPDALAPAWIGFRAAASEAFDLPVPDHAVYRALRTFAVAHWPALRAVLDGAGELGADTEAVVGTIDEATAALSEAIRARERGSADRLEREMALLRTLLDGAGR